MAASSERAQGCESGVSYLDESVHLVVADSFSLGGGGRRAGASE